MEGEDYDPGIRASPDVPTVDWSGALQRVGGSDDALEEIVQIFHADECPRLIQTIRDALASDDAITLERSAHTLKSNADLFGAQRVFDAARALEELAIASDFQGATLAWKTLEQELSSLCAELAKRES